MAAMAELLPDAVGMRQVLGQCCRWIKSPPTAEKWRSTAIARQIGHPSNDYFLKQLSAKGRNAQFH